MSKLLVFLLLVGTLSVPPVLALQSASPKDDGPRLVLHAPWADGVALVRTAGGQPVGPVTGRFGLLAYADEMDAFDSRLLAAGAWLVLDGAVMARICGIDET